MNSKLFTLMALFVVVTLSSTANGMQNSLTKLVSKDFALGQGKKFLTLLDKNRLATTGIVIGLGATLVAAKYAAPYVGWAYERAKINGKKLAVKSTVALDSIKQNVVPGIKSAAKVAVIGTIVASPVVAALACEKSEFVESIAHQAFDRVQGFVLSLFA